MYCDKDNRGRYSIMDLDENQFETIRRAMTAYRVGMVQNDVHPNFAINSEPREQYKRAGEIVLHLEKSL